jgi:uncharacterized protein HemX
MTPDTDESTLRQDHGAAPAHVDDRAPAPTGTPSARPGAGAGLALLLAVLAAGTAGWAAWRVLLLERSERTEVSSLDSRLQAMDVRLVENERRSARNNELAATLRDQLTESERLRDRMRTDLLALSERSARAESLLADMARERRGARAQLALADAVALVGQADTRLRLFGDREGAAAALELAGDALALAGSDRAALAAEVAAAAAALAADPRPTRSALLAQIDALALDVEGLPLRPLDAGGGDRVAGGSWWDRQFDRLDQLVTIRREDAPGDTAPSRDGAARALARARQAALDGEYTLLRDALASARTALLACCESAAGAPLSGRLDALLAIDWQAPLPDLAALRQRLDDQSALDRSDPVPAPATAWPEATAPAEPSEPSVAEPARAEEST